MDKSLYLDHEGLITESDNGSIILTTHRIRYVNTEYGKSHLISILLHKVSSIEMHYRSWPTLLYLGIGIGLVAIANLMNGHSSSTGAMGVVVATLLIIAFLFTRQHVVSISAIDGVKIHFRTKGMKRESLLKFINQVEQAIEKKRSIVL